MLSDEQIKEIMLLNGFSIKDGLSDLKPYVYAAARAIEQAARREALKGEDSKSTKPVCEESTFNAAWPDIQRAAISSDSRETAAYHIAKSAWMTRAALSDDK